MNDSFSIEINDLNTRMCDCTLVGDKIQLLSMGQKETSPFYFSSNTDAAVEKQAAIINKLQTELKISKRNVNIVIPDSYTYSQIIEMPRLREKELLAAIRYQADEFIPMPIDETSLDLEILREDAKTKKSLILIVASPKIIVDQLERTIIKANLVPQSLENELSATGRLFADILKQQGNAKFIINFGLNNTSIYVIDGASSLLILNKSFNIGLSLLVKDIAINLNWDEKKAAEVLRTVGLADNASYNLGEILKPLLKELLDEIEKTQILVHEKYGMKVDSMFVFNFTNQVAFLKEKIQQHFNINTQLVTLTNQLINNQVSKANEKDISSFIATISANLR